MPPKIGIDMNFKLGWRHLSPTIVAVCLKKFLMEITMIRINLFLQHYNAPMGLGLSLTASLQLIHLEAGLD